VWAPLVGRVEVEIEPDGRRVALRAGERGYHSAEIGGVAAGARYRLVLDGSHRRPDPASRFQPEGPAGPSEVVDPRAFEWHDEGWTGLQLSELMIYELHVGTFSREGTFDGIVPHLDDLRELGVTAVELMPVAQFPGERNWGYDGVDPFAVQNSYGGPDGLKRLVDACHTRGLALILDVVYNHLGPEGNHLGEFGPYFSEWYHTPWGRAINFDGPGSDEVRRFFIENALRWFGEYHVDALRLDAIHGVVDLSAHPFLQELGEETRRLEARLGRGLLLIAESDLGNPRVVDRPERGGLALDGQWSDDFHHALQALLTGERNGYYEDFGTLEHLAKAYRHGYVFEGQYSRFRDRRHGASAAHIPPERFVVFDQNHDQVGNRLLGERLAVLVDFGSLKLAAACVLLSPFVPLLFMGEEYGELAPFRYFVSHTDPELVEAVRKGRAAEFEGFAWPGEAPDPQAEETFLRCRLDHALKDKDQHRQLRALYRELLRLRREVPALRNPTKEQLRVFVDEPGRTILLHRGTEHDEAVVALRFAAEPGPIPVAGEGWTKVLDTADERWAGPGDAAGEARGATVFVRERAVDG
jgi:maltooligosyltrehalose trehalohydrolase